MSDTEKCHVCGAPATKTCPVRDEMGPCNLPLCDIHDRCQYHGGFVEREADTREFHERESLEKPDRPLSTSMGTSIAEIKQRWSGIAWKRSKYVPKPGSPPKSHPELRKLREQSYRTIRGGGTYGTPQGKAIGRFDVWTKPAFIEMVLQAPVDIQAILSKIDELGGVEAKTLKAKLDHVKTHRDALLEVIQDIANLVGQKEQSGDMLIASIRKLVERDKLKLTIS